MAAEDPTPPDAAAGRRPRAGRRRRRSARPPARRADHGRPAGQGDRGVAGVRPRAGRRCSPTLPVGAQLDLTLDPTASGTGDAVYSVSLRGRRRRAARARSRSATPTCRPGYRMDRAAVADLVALGWSPPGVVDGLRRAVRPARPRSPTATRLAATVSRTLRDVYGAPHPAFLVYLGARRRGRAARRSTRSAPPGPSRASTTTALDDLDELTRAAAAGRPARLDEALPLDEQVRTVVAAMHEDRRRAAAGRPGRRHRHPGRLGDGLRAGTRQPAAGRRLLAGAHRGRADRAALRQALRADQPDADRPALLHQRHGVGVDPGLRPQLPGRPT